MGANPNTQTLKQVWMDQYQISHYKQPVFRAIAEEKMLEGMLQKGDTVHWSYMSDFYVENMGADGSYNTQAQADTDETLVINQTKDTSFYEFKKDLEQAHYDVKLKYAKKAMNKVFLQIDSDVLVAAYQGASSIIDAGVLAGGSTNGVGMAIGSTNVFQLFAINQQQLILQNVVYDPNLTFTKEVKLEKVEGMPVAIISAQIYTYLILYLGGKTTVLGDKVSVSGHAGAFMNFNIFVSNQVPSTTAVTIAAQPTDGDVFVYNGLTYTWKTTLGSTAGQMLIGASAAASQNALISALVTSPFVTTTLNIAQVNNVTNQLKLANISIAAFASNASTIVQGGIGTQLVTGIVFTSGSNSIGGTQNSTTAPAAVIQHNIFGVSRSVAIVIQKYPELYVNPVSGKVGKDYVTWCYYGIKVFKYMTTQIIDNWVNATTFSQPLLTVN